VVEKAALLSKNKEAVKFPKTYLGKDSLDFSFSGVKTAVLYHAQKNGPLGRDSVNDVCYAFQENALDTLVEKTFLAASKHKVDSIIVGGGVAANSRLREKFKEASMFSGGIKVHFPEKRYCMDNAAMVGVLGEELYRRGHRSDLYLSAEPNLEVINA
jgi:N6-L-threonylcarbamoyladenine synthase